ncbi:MAG: hypothetical protein ACYDH3_02765 [Candidatus Aminicenantales bacterium]
MNNKTRLVRIAAAAPLLAALLAAGSGSGTDILPPLIRRDLIRTTAPVFAEIKRDLFSTVPFVAGGGDVAGVPGVPGSGQPGSPRKEEELLPPPADVRYVGFVRNVPQKTLVAIVLIDDKAWAISEGELFAFGWSALKVTDKEVELQNPLGKKLVFMYEGERP